MKTLLRGCIVISILIFGRIDIKAQNPETLFQQGMIKAEGEGNLEEAIVIYNRIVDDNSATRNLRAKALMQMGLCYEKQGKRNAQEAFKKLLAEFSDQKEFVEMARKKLRELSGPKIQIPNILVNEQLNTNTIKEFPLNGISPDGRYFIYMDWHAKVKEIMRLDMQTGLTDSITTGNTWQGKDWSSPYNPICFPGGENIAYVLEDKDTRELRVINYDGTKEITVLSGARNSIPWLETITTDGKYLLGSLRLQEGNTDDIKLFKISVENKTQKEIAVINGIAKNFKFSPDNNYLVYQKSQGNSMTFNNLFIFSLKDKLETQITFDKSNESQPFWSPDGMKLLFLTNKMGSNDLYRIDIKEGRATGKPKLVKRNLGNQVQIHGMDYEHSLYYSADNSRFDLFTLDLNSAFELSEIKVNAITDVELEFGAILPSYSKDGRYISYLSGFSNKNGKDESDKTSDLGQKYYVGIYDKENRTHRELNLDLYLNHSAGLEKAWHKPSWSHDGNKLLLHARIKENYQGGFYTVNVHTEEITPLLTIEGCQNGTKYKRFGHSMHLSNSGDKIYFLEPGFKNLTSFNIENKEQKVIVTSSDNRITSYWFSGFLDEGESQCLLENRNGTFVYNVHSNELKRIAEREFGSLLGISTNRQYYYFFTDDLTLIRKSINGESSTEKISLEGELPGEFAHGGGGTVSFCPNGKEMVFSRKVNSGKDTYKLKGIFD